MKSKKITILLNEVENVKQFVGRCSRFEDTIKVNSDGYIVNGKSILGLFSLDLSTPVDVIIYSEDETILLAFEREMATFIVKDNIEIK